MKVRLWTVLWVILAMAGVGALLGPLGYIWLRILLDPAPKGEGSFKQAAEISGKFRKFHDTGDPSVLPKGYVRMENVGLRSGQRENGKWLIYYATASHSFIRGGTLVALDDAGRLDVYFGHHCTSNNGGPIVALNGSSSILGNYFDGDTDVIREGFKKSTFKLRQTEQLGPMKTDSKADK